MRLSGFAQRRGLPAVVVTVFVLVLAIVAVVLKDRPAPVFVQAGPSADASPAASESASALSTGDACAVTKVTGMPLEARVGQLLMVGTPVSDPARVLPTVGKYQLGGVFLSGRGSPTAASLRENVARIQDAARKASGLSAHIALDQEGGKVQTLSGADFPAFPTAVQQGGWDTATLRANTTDWARRLASSGVTMDLAPVADVVPPGTAGANPPIGALSRHYGSTSDSAAADVATVVDAVQAAGVMTTLKHFPGLGRVRHNTDTSDDAVDELTTADDPALLPFEEGIRAGTGAVMMSSALYPKLDARAIAVFSQPIVTGLLRERLGFTGVIVSDDLGSAEAVDFLPVGERAVAFVRAGGDLALTVRLADAGPMSAALVAAAKASADFESRVTDAAVRVVRSKVSAGLVSCSPAP